MNTKNIALMTLLLVLAGCAGSTTNPVFNSSVRKAYIYSPVEVKALGLGAKFAKATGEARYCAAGMPALVQSRKSEALAAIAEACGGEDKYAIIDELKTDDAPGKFMGVEVQCTGFAGRIVYFTCKGAKPRPTAYDK
jgi:hypothetical protein